MISIHRWFAPISVGAVLAIGCAGEPDGSSARASSTPISADTAQSAPDTSTFTAPAEDGQWVMSAHDYAGTRFSGLNQITTENADQLRLAGTFSTGVLRWQEAAPIVVDHTMYAVTPYPNILYALDLSRPGESGGSFAPVRGVAPVLSLLVQA